MEKRALFLVFLLGFSLLPTPAISQATPFSLVGTVYDIDGETLLAGANVTVKNLNSGDTAWNITDDGTYVIDLNKLEAGVWSGDTLRITVIYEGRYGENTTIVSMGGPFVLCDVYTAIDQQPLLEHTPFLTVDEGTQVEFSLNALDDVGITGAELRIWSSVEEAILYGMEQDGDTWTAEVYIDSVIFPSWPNVSYNITVSDGWNTIATPSYMVWVNDVHPPAIICDPGSHVENTNVTLDINIQENHGLLGASVVYGGNNISLELPQTWNGSEAFRVTIPAQDVQIPSIDVTINAWDLNSTTSNSYVVTVLDITPPSVVPNFTAMPQSGNLNITLDWNAATDNDAVARYQLERSSNGISWDWQVNLSSTTLSYVDNREEPLSQYFYRIRARDASNNWGSYTEANATTSDINPPAITHQAISAWNESTDMEIAALIQDDNGTQAAFVWYDNGSVSDTVPMSFDGTNWTATIGHTILSIGQFSYRIEASDGVNWAQTDTFIVDVLDATPPSSVPNLTATSQFGTLNITIEWDAATDNVAVERYELERSLDNSTWDWQVNLSSSTLSYVDSDGEKLTTYYYRIRARDARFNRGVVSDANAITSDANPPNITHQAITTWDEKTDIVLTALIEDDSAVQSAFVWYDNGSVNTMVPMSFNGTNWTATIDGANLTVGYFSYRIGATDGVHWRQTKIYEVNVLDITPPSVTPNFTAASQPGTLDIILEWDSATDNVAVEGYELERSSDNTTWGWHVDLSSYARSYIDGDRDPQTQYFYRIRARDALNNSESFAESDTTSSDLNPPNITHQAILAWNENSDIEITATIEDEGNTIIASVWYDNGTATETIPMAFDGANWTATISREHIPGPTHVPEGNLIYRIVASDGNHWRQTDIHEVWVMDNTPPSDFDLSVSMIEEESVYPRLTWTSATDNLGVQEYLWKVQTQLFEGEPEEPFSTATQEEGIVYTDAQPDTNYYFAVAAYDGRNIGPWVFNFASIPALVVDNAGPRIVHNSPGSAKVGENLKLEAIITDQSGVSKADIVYWSEDANDSRIAKMSYSGGSVWKGIIPFSFVTGSEIHYCISSTDTKEMISEAGNTTEPYSIQLVGREVAATLPTSITMDMVPGKNMSLTVNLSTSANATWYFFLELDGAISSTGTIGNNSVDLRKEFATPMFLEAGEHRVNITTVFSLERNETATGTLRLVQSDANNSKTILLTFVGEETSLDEPKVAPWLLYVFVGVVVILLVAGGFLARYIRPR